MSNNRKQQAEYDLKNGRPVRGKLLWSVRNKWWRHDCDWDLTRAKKKEKIEMIIDKQTKQENE